jgi:hypothetical protein
MEQNSLGDVFASLGEQLVALESTTRNLTARFENLSRETEEMKLEILQLVLENRKASQSRSLGFAHMKSDHRKLGLGLALAVSQSLLQAAIHKDGSLAIAAGISGFNHFSQGLGDASWAVSSDTQFIVVPRDKVFPGHRWVTWESLQNALRELKQDTTRGEKLGNLDVVASKLEQNKNKLVYLFIPMDETSPNQ